MPDIAVTPIDSLCPPTPLDRAWAEWRGFAQLAPVERTTGPKLIFELNDRPDGAWTQDYHWNRPAPVLDAIGCYFLQDIELWAPGVAIHQTRLISDGSDTDRDLRRSLPPLREDGFFDIALPADRVIDRPLLIADGINHPTWGHWLVEYLPRFAIARALLGARFDTLAIALPEGIAGWAIDLLRQTCGVQDAALIFYKPLQERLICARAVQPSVCYTGSFTFHSFIRRFYASLTPPRSGPLRKLCVSRGGDAVAGSNRKFPQRETFERLAAARGYDIVRPETMPLRAQTALFANASVVVGEHGSGMHNTVFCPDRAIIGCIGFWNIIQLHLGYVCDHRNVYLTRGCVWPSEGQPDFLLNVTEDSLVAFFDRIEAWLAEEPVP